MLVLNITLANPELNKIKHVAALPGGGAVVNINYRKVVQVDSNGHTVKDLYNCVTCSRIHGLLVQGENLRVIHQNGNIDVIRIQDGKFLQTYYIPEVGAIYQYGTQYWDTDEADPDLLLLTDWIKKEVFSYRFSTNNKQVHIKELSLPFSVSYFFNSNSTWYIVCDRSGHSVYLYDSNWNLVRTVEGYGSTYGKLVSPHTAMASPKNTIIVADTYNYRISEFSIQGEFLRHVLTDVNLPNSISVSYTHIFVVANWTSLYSYKLYEKLNI